jgi:hypothetical protein
MKTLLVFLLVTSPVFAQDRAAAVSSCGDTKVKFDVREDLAQQSLTELEPSKAVVYVIEDYPGPECIGGCVTVRVGLDGAWVGANQGKSYFFFTVPPGEHHLCSNWQSSFKSRSSYYSLANFTAEAGKTYYFRSRLWSDGSKLPRLDLDQINNDEGSYLIASSRLAISNPKK